MMYEDITFLERQAPHYMVEEHQYLRLIINDTIPFETHGQETRRFAIIVRTKV